MEVIKRNGSKVDFDATKICKAVKKAFDEVHAISDDERYANLIADIVDQVYRESDKQDDQINVEQIQDIVENELIEYQYAEVAKAYIRYRYDHELKRQRKTESELLEMIDGDSEYWSRENSNKNCKWVTTQRDYIAGIVSKDYARNHLFPKDVVEAHDKGIIHIHDMDYMLQNTLTNCFSSDTSFVTSEGVKRFNDFYDGAPVTVRDMYGNWRGAVVRKFGKQVLYEVTLQSERSVQTIRCTRNHRWVLENGEVTDNIQVGDKLYALPDCSGGYTPQTLEEIKAFCFGFILGDGSDIPNSGGVRVRLCGHKSQDYVSYFEQAGYYRSSRDYGNEDCAFSNKDIVSKQEFLTGRMWRVMSLSQKIALFNGYYAADGNIQSNECATVDKRVFEMIQDLSAVAGYYVSSYKSYLRDTPYKDDALLFTVRFRKRQNLNNLWTVKSIKKAYNNNHASDVWCVVEPTTHTFTLASGIITGNCCLINLNDMLQNGTMVNGVMIEKPHRIITATTIATQIIAAVASSQYGEQ